MFGSSNPFGQSTNSPFGSPSVFGQTSNANNNPFATQPFGSTSPFGAQTGGSMFGGTSTGVFGASSPVFGVSSAPAFGASSSPAFGASSSAFGGSSVFGQTPAFGGFGSTTQQSSPFGSSFQQSQPAFGSSGFGSSPFGASSQPAFGAPSPTTPTFGSTPAFGAATSTPAFGSTSTPTFGNTGSAFGVSSTSVFGSSTPAFGASSTPAFGASSTPAFGASSTPAFGATTSPFSFGSTPAFGQSTSAFGSSPFGATTTPAFGAQSSPFGGQTTAPAFGSPGFGQPSFGSQRGGTRVSAYAQTPEADSGSSTQPAGKLESISAMPVYKEKSHEELRWEDYQLGDKGGPNPAGQSSAGTGFNMNNTQQANPFASSSPAFGQSSANPFSSSTSTNPFAPKTSTFGTTTFGNSTPSLGSSPFASAASNPFGSTPTPAPSAFGSTPAFGSTTSGSLFGSTPAFGTSTSIFGTTQAQGTTSSFATGLNFGSTQSSPLFQSTTPTLGQTSSPFGQTPSAFGQTASAFGQTPSAFGQTPSAFGQAAPSFGQSTPAFGQSNAFGNNLFSSTPSLLSSNSMGFNQTTPSLSTPFQTAQPTQNPGGFGFSAPAGGTPSIFGQSNFGQPSVNQSPQPQSITITNPFGTLPAMPQMSIGHAGNAPSIQYGISSLPVVDKPSPMRISSVLTSRHLSQRRIRLPARKYHPNNDGPKVSFFNDDEETTSTPKADALFIPRENPRALVIRPMEQWPAKASAEKPKEKNPSSPAQANGQYTEFASTAHQNGHSTDDGNRNHSENGVSKEQATPVRITQKTNGLHEDPKSDSYITLTGHRAGEAAIVYEHGADIETLMPKLRHSDYYTEPRIQELAAKERAEPGYCRRVKDFVVGRHNCGKIKFFGETDVRRLDLESLIQFNHREVIVYMDETKKPPVGQGLNKAAEVTLLNIKCVDKKTGRQFTEGPRVEKYKQMLKKKAEDQGAEFISYDPVKGEWKFRVSHFSRYGLEDALVG
ncbi:putative peptidase S59, nucleoporin, nucleoporin peptidase S59 [Helianthus annuus]|uniref:Nucleoporin autopeptidase n=1 Tax=Helianthus annuus TaxID=4232 RepID=A0A251SV14_HELAN|nr:nuclear pore complex protein NUP98A [Helianthus annuus]XP_022002114.1 nuclear pore complex protein NUP98A [Helianthus annuus]XP_022002115.1 nuclear pore complex protein NUP98A [Helianthus annuus]XP_035838003.1 nuclear pore complex protein NUP98A [Helianthus annuus]KAF5774645.1 putative peptidase S59, nucleoporin, nucleoporin peptidase S59 [Helianthus annuus]KAJ0850457.1 putative peptidase S59, nucleoporin, nucleoporin peptidase S59 [Helianthus annuus]